MVLGRQEVVVLLFANTNRFRIDLYRNSQPEIDDTEIEENCPSLKWMNLLKRYLARGFHQYCK